MEKVITLFTLLLSITYVIHTTVSHFTIIVAKDGSGNFNTISKALEVANNYSKIPIYIRIRKGIYKENVQVQSYKTNIVFIGDGINKTIITGNRSPKSGWGTYDSATVGVDGAGFTAIDITFQNTAGPRAGQAVAFRSSADKTAMYRCSFKGYQDTLYTVTNRQFYKKCEIYGTVDFIFGNAAAVIQNSKIYIRALKTQRIAVITAQGRDITSYNTGFSIQNCSITREPGSPKFPTMAYLGRPWRNYSRVVIMGSYLGHVVKPLGWLYWGDNIRSMDKVYYGEYKNIGPGANISKRIKCLGCLARLKPYEAQMFTVRNFINGVSWLKYSGIPFSLDL